MFRGPDTNCTKFRKVGVVRILQIRGVVYHRDLRAPSSLRISREEERVLARALETLDRNTWMLVLDIQESRKTLLATATRFSRDVRDNVRAIVCPVTGDVPFQELADPALRLLRIDPERRLLDHVVDACAPIGDVAAVHDARAAGRDVRNRFVASFLGLAISVARRFPRRQMQEADLVQDAAVALIRAVYRFDHQQGFRFVSYAHRVIEACLRRRQIKSAFVPVPEGVVYPLLKVQKARDRLIQELGREPRDAELARATGQSVASLHRLSVTTLSRMVSCDAPLATEGRRCLLDRFATETMAPDEYTRLCEISRFLTPLLEELTPIERDVLERRFGLMDGTEQTLQSIGNSYRVTRERIRQVEATALRKLRSLCERERLEA